MIRFLSLSLLASLCSGYNMETSGTFNCTGAYNVADSIVLDGDLSITGQNDRCTFQHSSKISAFVLNGHKLRLENVHVKTNVHTVTSGKFVTECDHWMNPNRLNDQSLQLWQQSGQSYYTYRLRPPADVQLMEKNHDGLCKHYSKLAKGSTSMTLIKPGKDSDYPHGCSYDTGFNGYSIDSVQTLKIPYQYHANFDHFVETYYRPSCSSSKPCVCMGAGVDNIEPFGSGGKLELVDSHVQVVDIMGENLVMRNTRVEFLNHDSNYDLLGDQNQIDDSYNYGYCPVAMIQDSGNDYELRNFDETCNPSCGHIFEYCPREDPNQLLPDFYSAIYVYGDDERTPNPKQNYNRWRYERDLNSNIVSKWTHHGPNTCDTTKLPEVSSGCVQDGNTMTIPSLMGSCEANQYVDDSICKNCPAGSTADAPMVADVNSECKAGLSTCDNGVGIQRYSIIKPDATVTHFKVSSGPIELTYKGESATVPCGHVLDVHDALSRLSTASGKEIRVWSNGNMCGGDVYISGLDEIVTVTNANENTYAGHGITGVITAPTKTDDHSCSSCDAGYHLEGNLCVENVCTCSVGTLATSGPACPTHGAEGCGVLTGGTIDCGGATITLTAQTVVTSDLTVRNCHFEHDSNMHAFHVGDGLTLTLIASSIKTNVKRITSGDNTCTVPGSSSLTSNYLTWCSHLAQGTANGGTAQNEYNNYGSENHWSVFPYGCFGYQDKVFLNKNHYAGDVQCDYNSNILNNACICAYGFAIHADGTEVILKNSNVDGVIYANVLKMEKSTVLMIWDVSSAGQYVDARNSRLILSTEVTPRTCSHPYMSDCPNCVDTAFGVKCQESCSQDQYAETTGGGLNLVSRFTNLLDKKRPAYSTVANGVLFTTFLVDSGPFEEAFPGGTMTNPDGTGLCVHFGSYESYAYCQRNDHANSDYTIFKVNSQGNYHLVQSYDTRVFNVPKSVGLNSNGKLVVRFRKTSSSVAELNMEDGTESESQFTSSDSLVSIVYIKKTSTFWYIFTTSFTDDLSDPDKYSFPSGFDGTQWQKNTQVLDDYLVFGTVENEMLSLHEYHPTGNEWKYNTRQFRSSPERGWNFMNRGYLIGGDGKTLFIFDGYSIYKDTSICKDCPNGLLHGGGNNPFNGPTECDTVRLFSGQSSGSFELRNDIELSIATNGVQVTLTGDLTITGMPDTQGNKPAVTVPANQWYPSYPSSDPRGSPYKYNLIGQYIYNKGIFQVPKGKTLRLVNVTLQGASMGAIINRGTFECIDCEFKNNDIAMGEGAIYNTGIMYLTNSHFEANSIKSYRIIQQPPSCNRYGCQYPTAKLYDVGSKGGAIYNKGSMYITSCTFSGNRANEGAHIYSDAYSYAEIEDSTFESLLTSNTKHENGEKVYGVEMYGRYIIQFSHLRDGFLQDHSRYAPRLLSNNEFKGSIRQHVFNPIYAHENMTIKDSSLQDASVDAWNLVIEDSTLDNSPVTVHKSLHLLRASLSNVATAVTVSPTMIYLKVEDSTITGTESIVSDGVIGSVTLDMTKNCGIEAIQYSNGPAVLGWKCPMSLNDLTNFEECTDSTSNNPQYSCANHPNYQNCINYYTDQLNNKRSSKCYDYGSTCAVCQGCIAEPFISAITGSTITPDPDVTIGDNFDKELQYENGEYVTKCLSQSQITPVLEPIQGNRKSGLRAFLTRMNKMKVMIAREKLNALVFREATRRIRVLKEGTQSSLQLNSDESVYVPLETGEEANVTLSNYNLDIKLEQTSGGLKVTVGTQVDTLQSGEGVIHGKIKIVAD